MKKLTLLLIIIANVAFAQKDNSMAAIQVGFDGEKPFTSLVLGGRSGNVQAGIIIRSPFSQSYWPLLGGIIDYHIPINGDKLEIITGWTTGYISHEKAGVYFYQGGHVGFSHKINNRFRLEFRQTLWQNVGGRISTFSLNYFIPNK
jgi:hypothetical protein